MSLAKKTTIGVVWNFAEQLCRRGIGVAIALLLARFLSPEDYGLVAMMQVFLALGNSLMDSGFSQSLIRLPNAQQTDFNTGFYSNIILGLISYGILFVSAPYIADFYARPELLLLIRVASIAIIISSFQVVQRANLSRALNFKVQLKASIPSGIISGLVAVYFAYLGYGVWALIIQMLLAAFITTVLLWYFLRWRPTASFSRRSFARMFSFGYKLFLSGVLNTIFENLYVILISKFFTSTIAGYYFFADKIRGLVASQLLQSIQTVTYPALVTLQNDNVRLKSGYRKVISVVCFIFFPAMLFLAAMAQHLFAIFLPKKWQDAVPYLQLMCFSGLLLPLHSINLNILKVKGRSDLFLFLEVIKKVITIVTVAISFRFGIYGILIGQICSSIICYLPNGYYSARLINYPIREQLADITPTLLLSATSALVTYYICTVSEWNAIIELVVALVAGIAVYLCASSVFRINAFKLAKELALKKHRSPRK